MMSREENASPLEALEAKSNAAQLHRLKTWPTPFALVWNGSKPFEIRKNDRDFKVGDVLLLEEYDPDHDSYSGRGICAQVTCIIQLSEWVHGADPAYVALGLKDKWQTVNGAYAMFREIHKDRLALAELGGTH